jgi:CubicO group peptidase (beta-lactamase class C family)
MGQQLPDVHILEAFMDGTIESLMEKDHINGVTVSIVNRDSIYWSKGYGYADSDNDIRVDPEKSLFRMGSVSKLFVWTAVMQLYEDGLIDLDRDITEYISDFSIPDNYQEPITMRHLMTHTPGFEDYYFSLFSVDSLPPSSLGEELKKHMPSRVRKPGVHSSYSNHGTSIAAYIVEKVSNLGWDEYVEQRIFQPLGMDITSFRYVLPERLKPIHSKGYTYTGGIYKSQTLKGIPLAPAGLATTSADDMAPFMMAHLNHGKYNGYQMLDSATVAMMHTQIFTHDPDLRGFCYGFFNLSQNGYKIIGHGGATEYFFSYLQLLPDDGYGIFISTNTQGGTDLIRRTTNLMIQTYFPDTTEKPSNINISDDVLARYNGSYLPNRRPIDRMTKIVALTNDPLSVSHKDGMIITSGGETNRWFPIDSNTFQHEKYTTRLSFDTDEDNQYNYLYMDSSPHTAFERIKTLETESFNILILIWSAGMGLLALIIWCFSYLIKKSYNIKDLRQLPLISKILVAINTLLIIVFLILVGNLMASTDFIFRASKTSDYVIMSIPILIFILTLLIFYLSLSHFRQRVKWRSSIFYFIIATGMVAMTAMLYYWNMIGYKF